jgi:2-hydroxy-3-keto-5-methylthiopentenyl-1-phosphate phosphatase
MGWKFSSIDDSCKEIISSNEKQISINYFKKAYTLLNGKEITVESLCHGIKVGTKVINRIEYLKGV